MISLVFKRVYNNNSIRLKLSAREALPEREWIYFIFKTNNISRRWKPQVINHKWVKWPRGDVVPHERKREKAKKKKYIYETILPSVWYRSSQTVLSLRHYTTPFPYKSTAVKIIIIFRFTLSPYTHTPRDGRFEYNFIATKTTWLISVVVSRLRGRSADIFIRAVSTAKTFYTPGLGETLRNARVRLESSAERCLVAKPLFGNSTIHRIDFARIRWKYIPQILCSWNVFSQT